MAYIFYGKVERCGWKIPLNMSIKQNFSTIWNLCIFVTWTKPLRGSFISAFFLKAFKCEFWFHINLGFFWYFSAMCLSFLFTATKDYAILVTNIIMKKESGYFTHIAFFVPTHRLRTWWFYPQSLIWDNYSIVFTLRLKLNEQLWPFVLRDNG